MSISSPLVNNIKSRIEASLKCEGGCPSSYEEILRRIKSSTKCDYDIQINKVDITSYLLEHAPEATRQQYQTLLIDRYNELKAHSDTLLIHLAKTVAYVTLPFFSFGNLSLSMFCDDNRVEFEVFEQSINNHAASFLVRDAILSPEAFEEKLNMHSERSVEFAHNNCYFSVMFLMLQTNKDLLRSMYKKSHELDAEYFNNNQLDHDDKRHHNYVEKMLIFLSKLVDSDTSNNDLTIWGQRLRGAFGPFLTNDTLIAQMYQHSSSRSQKHFAGKLNEKRRVSQHKQSDVAPMLLDYLQPLFRVKLRRNNDGPKSIVCRYALEVDSLFVRDSQLYATKGNDNDAYTILNADGTAFKHVDDLYEYLASKSDHADGVRRVFKNDKSFDVRLSPSYIACAIEELNNPATSQAEFEQLNENIEKLKLLSKQLKSNANKPLNLDDLDTEIKKILQPYYSVRLRPHMFCHVLDHAIRDLELKQEYENYIRFSSPLFFEHTMHYDTTEIKHRFRPDNVTREEKSIPCRYRNHFTLPAGNGINQSVQHRLTKKTDTFFLSDELTGENASLAVHAKHRYTPPKWVNFDMQIHTGNGRDQTSYFEMFGNADLSVSGNKAGQSDNDKKSVLSIFDKSTFSVNGNKAGTSIIRFKVDEGFKYYQLRAIAAKSGNAEAGHWTFFKLPTLPGEQLKFFDNCKDYLSGKEIKKLTDTLNDNFTSGLTLLYEQIETPNDKIVNALQQIDSAVLSPTYQQLLDELRVRRKQLMKIKNLPQNIQKFVKKNLTEAQTSVYSDILENLNEKHVERLKRYLTAYEVSEQIRSIQKTSYSYLLQHELVRAFKKILLNTKALQFVKDVLTVTQYSTLEKPNRRANSRFVHAIRGLTEYLQSKAVSITDSRDIFAEIFQSIDDLNDPDSDPEHINDLLGVSDESNKDEEVSHEKTIEAEVGSILNGLLENIDKSQSKT